MEQRSVFGYGQYFSMEVAWKPLNCASLKELSDFNFLISDTICLKGQRNPKEGN